MFSEPVVGERFFGRGEVLDLLGKRVSALKDGYRQNVALTGQSLSGKTSILHHFLYSVKEEDFITVYVEVIREPFKSFADRFIATLLYNALAKTGRSVGFELEGLLGEAALSVPRTHAAIRSINSLIDKSDLEEAYLSLLALTSTLKEEIKRSCVVILDEFDNLEYIGVKNPFLGFGKVIMIQKDTMYIVSSSRNQVFKKILSEKLSLLFGNFEIVRVSGFDAHNARRFVDTRLDGFDIDDPVRKFLIAFTEGNPFYLNHLVKSFKAVASERMSNHISADIAAQAMIDTIYDSSGVIHQYLMNFVLDLLDSKSRDRYMSVLTSVAAGRNKLSSVSRSAKIKQSDASKDLAHLCDLGLLSKNGIFYRIDDPVLAFWIDKVYNKRKNLLVDGIFNRDELFYSQARRYISEFIDESSKDITERVAELFNAFSNDLVQIDSKQLRLPRFTRVETGTFAGEGRYIAATFRGNSWVVCAREEGATESDIVEYIRNVKSLEHKVSNRVLIALGGIDENARLLAKELKISVWDINTLNALLNAYGKNRIAL